MVWREEYKPYGERLQQAPASTGNTLWYTGKAHEAPMGLSYFGARWHDPELGRFTGIDPVDVQGENLHSFNRYAYGNNNPYKFTDPDGRNPKLILDFGLNVALNYATTGQFNVLGAVRETVLGALNPVKTLQNAKKLGNTVAKGRKGAFNEAKDKAGIPRSQQPDSVRHERLTDQQGNVQSREFDFTRVEDGASVTIREHSLGHKKGNLGPHFNTEVRPRGGGPRQSLKGGADEHTFFKP